MTDAGLYGSAIVFAVVEPVLGIFLFFICFAGEHAAGGEDVFTARAAYGADYSARIEVVAEGSHVLFVACAKVYARDGMIANEVDANKIGRASCRERV